MERGKMTDFLLRFRVVTEGLQDGLRESPFAASGPEPSVVLFVVCCLCVRVFLCVCVCVRSQGSQAFCMGEEERSVNRVVFFASLAACNVGNLMQ